MSAARLREAAKVLRERADAATPGPWEADSGEISQHWSRDDPWLPVASNEIACMAYCYGGSARGIERDEDAAYIATTHPGVGLALARALDTAADAFGHADLCLDCFHPTCLTVGELIPVADLILGGQS